MVVLRQDARPRALVAFTASTPLHQRHLPEQQHRRAAGIQSDRFVQEAARDGRLHRRFDRRRSQDHQPERDVEGWRAGHHRLHGQAASAPSDNAPSSGSDQTSYESHCDVNSTLDAIPGKALKTNIGGTSLIPYPVTPGTINLGFYKSGPGACGGTPDIGPASIDGAEVSRTLVLVYGTSATALKLLVLPVPS